MTHTPLFARYLAALALTGITGPALAQDRGPIDQNVQASLGGFFMNFDTSVRLDGEATGTGTDVDWESEFDLPDHDRFRIDGFWRFAEHHKVRLMYFENNRSATETLTRDIDFGDTTYPASVQVDARMDTRIIELAYEYAFMKRENLELAGSIGIHNIRLEAALRGTTGAGTAEVEEVAEGDGPLPVVGVHFLWNMGANFYFDGLAQFFFAEIDNYDGSLQDYKVTVTWFPLKNFGVGVGFNQFVTRLSVDKDSFTGRMRVKYGGPLAFFTVGF